MKVGKCRRKAGRTRGPSPPCEALHGLGMVEVRWFVRSRMSFTADERTALGRPEEQSSLDQHRARGSSSASRAEAPATNQSGRSARDERARWRGSRIRGVALVAHRAVHRPWRGATSRRPTPVCTGRSVGVRTQLMPTRRWCAGVLSVDVGASKSRHATRFRDLTYRSNVPNESPRFTAKFAINQLRHTAAQSGAPSARDGVRWR